MGKLNDSKEIGDALRNRRQGLKLSQKHVARDCDMVYATVSSAELGREISMRNLMKICDRLQLKITLTPIKKEDDFEY